MEPLRTASVLLFVTVVLYQVPSGAAIDAHKMLHIPEKIIGGVIDIVQSHKNKPSTHATFQQNVQTQSSFSQQGVQANLQATLHGNLQGNVQPWTGNANQAQGQPQFQTGGQYANYGTAGSVQPSPTAPVYPVNPGPVSTGTVQPYPANQGSYQPQQGFSQSQSQGQYQNYQGQYQNQNQNQNQQSGLQGQNQAQNQNQQTNLQGQNQSQNQNQFQSGQYGSSNHQATGQFVGQSNGNYQAGQSNSNYQNQNVVQSGGNYQNAQTGQYQGTNGEFNQQGGQMTAVSSGQNQQGGTGYYPNQAGGQGTQIQAGTGSSGGSHTQTSGGVQTSGHQSGGSGPGCVCPTWSKSDL